MRVTYFSHSTIPSQAANSLHVVFMSAAMADMGAQVKLFSWASQQGTTLGEAEIKERFQISSSIQHCHYTYFGLFGFSYITALIAGLGTVITRQNLVIGRYLRPCFFASLFGKPVIFETHQPLDTMTKLDQWMLKSLARSKRCRGIVTISQPLADILREELASPDAKLAPIIVASDAANEVTTTGSDDLGQDYRLHVGYVGGLYEGRGIEIIIGLARSLPSCCFHVAGGSGAEVEKWQKSTIDLPNLIFYGHLTTKDAERLRVSCGCLIAPYQFDTSVPGGMNTSLWMSPMKLFEYMAAGKAIICSDIPVLHEALTADKTALMVPPADLAAWINAVKKLCDDEGLRNQLAKAALDRHLQHGTWMRRCEKIFRACRISLTQHSGHT